jgi:uncharacterized protein (TIGR00290 family)
MKIENKNFFCSWSGGKDSCLALYKSIKEGGTPSKLLTMLVENGKRSRSHGLHLEILRAQASSLNIPLITGAASWDNYESTFVSLLEKIKSEGIRAGVFGDIDIEDHRKWVKRVCETVGVEVYHPLWKRPRKGLLEEFIDTGFKAVIIAIKDGVLDRSFLGRVLDYDLIKEFEKQGVDPSGEEGEYHTVVVDGPIFSYKIPIRIREQILSNGYWFQNVSIE